jgi:hypothetical protein
MKKGSTWGLWVPTKAKVDTWLATRGRRLDVVRKEETIKDDNGAERRVYRLKLGAAYGKWYDKEYAQFEISLIAP